MYCCAEDVPSPQALAKSARNRGIIILENHVPIYGKEMPTVDVRNSKESHIFPLEIGLGVDLDFSPVIKPAAETSSTKDTLKEMGSLWVEIGLDNLYTPDHGSSSDSGSESSADALSGDDDNPEELNDRFIQTIVRRRLRDSTIRARAGGTLINSSIWIFSVGI